MSKPKNLISPTPLGPLNLAHRVVLAPLTRLRGELPGSVPGDLMVEYYEQRASAGGLLITEATAVSEKNGAYLGAPGIYSAEQIAGWKKVTDAVHKKGGYIFLQLWHPGRTSHADLNGGESPTAPSAIQYEGVVFTANGWGAVSPTRALALDEIPGVVAQFETASRNALAAGFDGVEIHAANGYLVDQFLQDISNNRKDAYGGSIENRTRFLLEVTKAAENVYGAGRVGVRISPSGTFNGMGDSNPEALFDHVATKLNFHNLAYLHVIEPRVSGSEVVEEGAAPVASARLRKLFDGKIIAAGGFEADTADAAIADGTADLVAFGRHFIANPDLPKRYELGLELNPYDRNTFYATTAEGYIDYPEYEEKKAVA